MFFKFYQLILDYFIVIIFLPIFIIIFLLIFFLQIYYNGFNIFFIQERYGLNKKKFKILKFKTISFKNNKEIINPFSKFLRRSSLDELPQILNVIKRDMSIVGPRPYPPDTDFGHKSLRDINIDLRFSTLPGITGLSQVNYNGKERTLFEKISYDLIYVENLSIKIYCVIVLKTFIVLIKRYKKNKSGKSFKSKLE